MLRGLRDTEATFRLKAFAEFLNSTALVKDIVEDVPSVDRIIKRSMRDHPPVAGSREEIVGVGLHIMKECSRRKDLADLAVELGIVRTNVLLGGQKKVDEVMERFIEPALDYVEEKLVALAGEGPAEQAARELTEGVFEDRPGVESVGSGEESDETSGRESVSNVPAEKAKKSKRDEESATESSKEPIAEEAWINTSSVSDQPTVRDELGFEPYVRAVADFLSNKDTRPPLTLSVEGDWGSGKSSFMLQLERELRDRGGSFVKFSPWRHEDEKSLWSAFALEFVRQLSAELGWWQLLSANMRLRWRRFNWREGWFDLVKVALISIAWFLAAVVLVVAFLASEDLFKYEEFPSIARLMTVVSGCVLVTLGLKELKKIVGSPLDVDLRKYVQKPNYKDRMCFLERFHEDFKRAVDVYATSDKVYVFIDDLDRCQVPRASDLMEMINLMISDDPKLIFIIGMDREKVAAGLACKHEKILPYVCRDVWRPIAESDNDVYHIEGLEYGYAFLEKFVQVPFSVPKPSGHELDRFLDSLNRGIMPLPQSREREPAATKRNGSKDDARIDSAEYLSEGQRRVRGEKSIRIKFGSDSPEMKKITLMVASFLGNNPRRVKQFINLLRLRTYIAFETGLFYRTGNETSESALTLEKLGKFVAISIKCPFLLRELELDRRLLSDLQIWAQEFGARPRSLPREYEKLDRRMQRWVVRSDLIELLRSGCFNAKGELDVDGERICSLAGLDLERLLQISPQMVRSNGPATVESSKDHQLRA